MYIVKVEIMSGWNWEGINNAKDILKILLIS